MTIFYTLIKETKTNKIISGEFSPQSENTKIGKDLLKELKDSQAIEEVSKVESNINSQFVFFLYKANNYLFSVIIDKYEKDKNVYRYVNELHELLNKKEYKSYEFDSVIKDKSNEYNKDRTLAEIDETKNVLADSLNLIIQRRENINNISKLADRLTFETKEMHTSIKNMQFNNLLKEYGTYAVIIFIFILFFYYVLH